MQYFGVKLKRLRESRNLTQAQLADHLGLVQATVSAYEQSRTYPSVDVLVKICSLFHVSADEMLGLSGGEPLSRFYLSDSQLDAVRHLISVLEAENINKNEQPL